jgi:hypothetical protein
MEKVIMVITFLMSVEAMMFSGCEAAESEGESNLSGNISINPADAKLGAELSAAYTGKESVNYQWKCDGINTGTNSEKITANAVGSYTVTVSKSGYKSKTSGAVNVISWNTAKPIITSIFTADPSAHVWSTDPNRLYLYPSTDIFPARGCNMMDQYHVFSTENMVDWIDHGEILRRDDLPIDPWGPHYSDAYFMWAPDAAYNPSAGKGPYFYVFPHSTGADGTGSTGWDSNWKLGVAYSDSPYKGFKDNEVVMMRDKDGVVLNGTGKLIDPCFFEDDGVYYLVTGGSQEFRIAKLKNDMVTLAEDFRVYTQADLPYYHEGPWMFTRKNDSGVKIYYLMYPGNPGGGKNGDDMVYAVSDNPYGPWDFKGSFLEPVGTGDTSHGSIVEFKGKWYLFYHNARLSKGSGNLRSVCVDELFFNADGTIQKVIQTPTSVASNGPELDKASLDTKFGVGNYEVELDYSEMESGNYEGFALDKTYQAMDETVIVAGGATKNDDRTGCIHNLHLSGAYAEWTEVNGGAGGRALLMIDYALGGGQSSASLQVTVNGQANPLPFNCPSTGGWSAFKDSGFYVINMEPGEGNVIKFDGAGINIRSISIHLAQ